jgi:voltage-gated potassium channel
VETAERTPQSDSGTSLRELRRDQTKRERWAGRIEERLNPVIGVSAVVLVLLVLGDEGSPPNSVAHSVLFWMILAISLAFVLEFVLRVIIAPSTWGYLKRYWWQIPLLLLPFLSVIRIVAALRVGRAGRALMAAGHGTRSAGQRFRGRIGWLAGMTAIVILSATDLLIDFGSYRTYGTAIHDASMGAINGSALSVRSGMTQALDPLLAMYSVIVFAGLAATTGGLFLEKWRVADRRTIDRDLPISGSQP